MTILLVIERILPVFLVVGIGFAAGRIRPFEGRSLDKATNYLIYLAIPLLVFTSTARLDLSLGSAVSIAGAALFTSLLGTAVVLAGARVFRYEWRKFVLPVMLMNCGNLGIPINGLVFGEAGGRVAVLFYVTVSIVGFTLGVGLVAGRSPLKTVLGIPLIYAAAAGLASGRIGLEVPEWAERLAFWMTIPLLLSILGHDIALIRIESLKHAGFAAALRLSLGILAGLSAAHLLGIEGTARSVVIVESSMPSAVMSYVLARKFDASPEVAGGSVLLTTALAPFTVTAMIHLAGGAC